VAIPTRIDDTRTSARRLGRRPIVLARLPYVGADSRVQNPEPSVERQEVERQKIVPPPHHLPIASAPRPEISEPSSGSTPEEANPRPAGTQRRKQRIPQPPKGRPATAFRQQSQSTGLSSFLYTVHCQIAPFAGAIVALALIAAAGLLYWMIVSPSRVPTDFRDGVEEGLGTSTAELPKFVSELSSYASRTHATPASQTVEFEMPKWDAGEVVAEVPTAAREETPPTALQEQELVVALEAPAAKSPAEPAPVGAAKEGPSLVVGPVFPTTNRPTALDFTKIRALLGGEMRAGLPQREPVAEVAGRSVPQVLIPTRR